MCIEDTADREDKDLIPRFLGSNTEQDFSVSWLVAGIRGLRVWAKEWPLEEQRGRRGEVGELSTVQQGEAGRGSAGKHKM